MAKYNLELIVYVGYTDAGEPVPAKVINDTLEYEDNIRVIKAMLIRIGVLKDRNKSVPDYNIVAKITDESGRLVSAFDDL